MNERTLPTSRYFTLIAAKPESKAERDGEHQRDEQRHQDDLRRWDDTVGEGDHQGHRNADREVDGRCQRPTRAG